jgi:hypothetical protein
MNELTRKYSAVVNSRGGLRQTIRRHGILRTISAGCREVWATVGMGILHMLGKQPSSGYGWLEAVLFPRCDYWLRYALVLRGLDNECPGGSERVIEVSSGRGGLAWVWRRADLQICSVDRSEKLLLDGRAGNAWRVCADGTRLPFPDDYFDAAVSVDTVEHLPQELRSPFVEELKRVAREAVVVTCPMQSDDDQFRARDFDLKLHTAIAKRGGVQPEWLEEHIQQGHPTREILCGLLPGATVNGAENCDSWLRFQSLYERAFFWLFAGIFYLRFLKKRDAVPPYRRAVLIWKKPVKEEPEIRRTEKVLQNLASV